MGIGIRIFVPASILLAAVAPPASARKAPKKPPNRPLESCVQAGDPSLTKAQEKAAAATAAAFDGSLKKQGLKRASLKRHTIEKHRGIRDLDEGAGPRTTKEKPHVLGEPFEGTIDGVKGTYIAGPVYWTGGARPPADLELVQDDQGNLYRLERKITATHETRFTVCQCRRFECGSGCPACHSTVEIVYGPLPDGVTFKGPITVSYEATTVALDYTGICRATCPP